MTIKRVLSKDEYPLFNKFERKRLATICERVEYLRTLTSDFAKKEIAAIEWLLEVVEKYHDQIKASEFATLAPQQAESSTGLTGAEEAYFRSKRGLDGFDAGFRYVADATEDKKDAD